MRRLTIAAMVVFAWLVLGLAVDRLVLSRYCPSCATAAALELKVSFPAAQATYPSVSLLVLVIAPMAAFALAMVLWRGLRSRQAWTHAIESWWEPWFWLLVALLVATVCESLFIIAKAYLPASVAATAQRFSVSGIVSVHMNGFQDTTPLAITASACGLVGLAIGGYLFLQNGLNGVMRWFKA